MKWYKCTVPVGHTGTQGTQHYAPIYVRAKSIRHAEERCKYIPAVGYDKTPRRTKIVSKSVPDEVTNPGNGFDYSEQFMNMVSDPERMYD